MELKYYRLIKTIAEEGSIANSSEKLFLTQSALSHQLRELEERLGFKVFHRKRSKWILTNEGQELYTLAVQLFETIEKGFSKIELIKEGSKGKIELAVECQSFFHDLPGFIQKMGILYPEIDISLKFSSRHEIITKIKSDEVDIMMSTYKPLSDDLYSIEIYQDEIFAVVHKEHPFNEKDFVSPSSFADAHLIINSFPLEGVAIYEHCLRAIDVVPKKLSAIPFTEFTLSMVAANLGVMCSPKWQLRGFKLHEDLRLKRIRPNGVKRTHYMVVKKNALSKKYINNFISTFEEEFIEKIKEWREANKN
ncbi:MAG: LysR family transcriptional regulator [Saprospiraceae bacterium]